MTTMRQTWRLGAWALLLVVALIACGKGSASSAPLPPPPVHPSVVDAVIGPAGGTLTHPSGAQLVVPAGALAAPTRLTLNGASAPSRDVLGVEPLGQTIQAGPDGQTFLAPVEVIVPFDPTRLSPGEDANTVQLRMAPRGTTSFEALQSIVDLRSRTVRAKTAHFTDFIPAVNPNPVFITTPPTLPQATVGVPYTQEFAAVGGTTPYTWSLSAGSGLPPGLALASTGVLSGSPTIPTAFAFFVTATDSASHAVQTPFALTVVPPTNPLPVLAQIAPASAAQGSAATAITLTGSGFVPTSTALWDGAPLATTFSSATSLGASIPASALVNAGAHEVSVSSPTPGGGTSASLTFTVTPATPNPVPSIASVSPTQIPVSSVDVQIAIAGSNFVATSSAVIGAQGIPTSYVSSTQLQATIPASYLATAGTLQIGVYNPPPGGGFSTQTIPITVASPNPVPTLTALSPASVNAGASGFTLTATGTSFVAGGRLFFGSTALATTIASATSASATVPAALVASAGTVQVTFVNPTPGGGASGSLPFTVTSPSNPVPVLTALSQSFVPAGSSDFTLRVTGTGFASGGQVFFANTPLVTTVASSTSASATVPAALVKSPWASPTPPFGLVHMSFVNPPPGGGASGSLILEVVDTSPDCIPAGQDGGAVTRGGDYTVTSDADLTAIAGITWITGNLTISNTALTTLSLPNLRCAGGLTMQNNSALTSVALPNLIAVSYSNIGGSFIVSDSPLLPPFPLPSLVVVKGAVGLGPNLPWTSISLPALRSIGTEFLVQVGPSLTSLSAPLLNDVGFAAGSGGVFIDSQTSLTSVSFPSLTSSMWIQLTNDTALASAAFPNLTFTWGIDVENTALTSLDLSGTTQIGAFTLKNNPSLASVPMPITRAISDALDVEICPSLSSLGAPLLTTIGGLRIVSNDALQSVILPKLASSWSWDRGAADVTVSQNKSLPSLYLPALSSVASLEIELNGALAQLSAPVLTNPGVAGPSFSVDNNPSLPECQVKALEAQLPNVSVANDTGNSASCPSLVLTAVSPSVVAAGSGDFTLAANGTGFLAGGQLSFGGTALATMVASDTVASATVPAALVASPGIAHVTFVNPGGGATGALPFAIAAPAAGQPGSSGLSCTDPASGLTYDVGLTIGVAPNIWLNGWRSQYILRLTPTGPSSIWCGSGALMTDFLFIPASPTVFGGGGFGGTPQSMTASGVRINPDGTIAGAPGDVVGTATTTTMVCGATQWTCSGSAPVIKL